MIHLSHRNHKFLGTVVLCSGICFNHAATAIEIEDIEARVVGLERTAVTQKRGGWR